MIINRNTKITGSFTEPVARAVRSLRRDMDKVLLPVRAEGSEIRLIKTSFREENFRIREAGEVLEISAGDNLGFIYGIYEISRRWLGIEDFWFWNDQKAERKEEIRIPCGYSYSSRPFAVRYRGWFINDEVLLHTWMPDRDKDLPWEMAMETLLRCGGNLIIPGTDKNSEKYRPLAAAMGLYITHHHAEPLGAQMFSRAYPRLTPSYDEHPEKFERLWRDGIEKQKDCRVIWNLGFRGQGDAPFWEHDPRYQTMEERGALMSRLIGTQYRMVKEQDPGAVCCTNLYGETMELYRDGFLKLPDDVIKIWADNGFGRMVSRRQGNHNPRVPALPESGDRGRHGIYYHVSFYDLQAANHVTMLPVKPEMVKEELDLALQRGMDDYWIVNCSNIKPHVYYLDLLARMWREGEISVQEHRRKYLGRYYGVRSAEVIEPCLTGYFEAAVPYGENEDDRAGEQFVNHVPRMLISQYMRNAEHRAEDLLWAADFPDLQGQIRWFEERCGEGRISYRKLLQQARQACGLLEETAGELFEDSLLLQIKIYACCFEGAFCVCRSLLCAFEKEYQRAFYFAGEAREAYLEADGAMRKREHGHWYEFYANECLTDIKQTAWVLEGLMSYLRNLGDGPHYYKWQRDFLYSQEDRRVMLVLNMENHLKDQEIYALMKAAWEE